MTKINDEAREAFEKAITRGRLSPNPKDKNYVGNYMYMGECNGEDTFKNIMTRQYDV